MNAALTRETIPHRPSEYHFPQKTAVQSQKVETWLERHVRFLSLPAVSKSWKVTFDKRPTSSGRFPTKFRTGSSRCDISASSFRLTLFVDIDAIPVL
jgi:hypothetical protein